MCQALFWNRAANTMGTESASVYYAGVWDVSDMTRAHLHFNELSE